MRERGPEGSEEDAAVQRMHDAHKWSAFEMGQGRCVIGHCGAVGTRWAVKFLENSASWKRLSPQEP